MEEQAEGRLSSETAGANAKELQNIEMMQLHCKDVMHDAGNFESYDWKDPVWLGHQRSGHTKHMANKFLHHRIKSALYNISQQQKRGIELLNHRENEYTFGIVEETMSDISWSDGERDYGIEDDVPLEEDNKVWKPSRRWTAKHCRMEKHDSEWNRERIQAEDNRGRNVGHFNEMDGRYHQPSVNEAMQIAQFLQRTKDRKRCKYNARGWCKNGYGCTMRHMTEVYPLSPYDQGTAAKKYKQLSYEEQQHDDRKSADDLEEEEMQNAWTFADEDANNMQHIYRHFDSHFADVSHSRQPKQRSRPKNRANASSSSWM